MTLGGRCDATSANVVQQVYSTKFTAMFFDVFPAEEKAKHPTQ